MKVAVSCLLSVAQRRYEPSFDEILRQGLIFEEGDCIFVDCTRPAEILSDGAIEMLNSRYKNCCPERLDYITSWTLTHCNNIWRLDTQHRLCWLPYAVTHTKEGGKQPIRPDANNTTISRQSTATENCWRRRNVREHDTTIFLDCILSRINASCGHATSMARSMWYGGMDDAQKAIPLNSQTTSEHASSDDIGIIRYEEAHTNVQLGSRANIQLPRNTDPGEVTKEVDS